MKLTDILLGGASKLVDSVGKAIDENVTNDEERMKLKNAASEIVANYGKVQLDFLSNRDVEVSKRWSADMNSDSWLSKNIRPLVLIFLTLAVVTLAFGSIFATGLTVVQVSAINAWIPLFTVIMSAAYAAYFGGRSIEKVKQNKYTAMAQRQITVAPEVVDKVNETNEEKLKRLFGNLNQRD